MKRQTAWSAAGRVKKVVLWQKKPGCLWLSIWTCRPACKPKLEFLSKFWECLDSAFWVDLVLTHELVTKFVPTSVFPHKILGLLEARVFTLDYKVSHLYMIVVGFLISETCLPCWMLSHWAWDINFEMQAQAKGIYSIFSALPVLSQVKLQILWHPVMFCCWLQSG